MEYLGLSIIEEYVEEKTIKGIKGLKNAGINVFMVSGDHKCKAIEYSIRSGLFNKYHNIEVVRRCNTEEKCLRKLFSIIKDRVNSSFDDDKKSEETTSRKKIAPEPGAKSSILSSRFSNENFKVII